MEQDFALSSTQAQQAELQWLQKLIQYRASNTHVDLRTIPSLAAPIIDTKLGSSYGAFIQNYQLNFEERLLVILALAPNIAPQFIDREILYWVKVMGNQINEQRPMYGLVSGQMYQGVLPTVMLFIYITAGDNFNNRMELARKVVAQAYKVLSMGIVNISDTPVAEPKLMGILSINDKVLLELLL